MYQGKIRFHVSIVAAIASVVALVTLASLVSVYIASTRAATESAHTLFAAATRRTAEKVDGLVARTAALADMGASLTGVADMSGDGGGGAALPFMFRALADDTSLYSLYFADASGDFLQVIATREDPQIIAQLKAPADAFWLVRTIIRSRGTPTERRTFLDGERRPLATNTIANPEFDPRQRPWYTAAMADDRVGVTAPYVFNSSGVLGITAFRRAHGDGVFGADLSLSALSDFVEQDSISPHGGILLLDKARHLVALSRTLLGDGVMPPPLADLREAPSPTLRAVAAALPSEDGGDPVIIEAEGARLLVGAAAADPEGLSGVLVVAAAPIADFTGFVATMQMQIALLAVVILAVALPLATWLARRMARVVNAMAEDAKRIQEFDFTGTAPQESRILEFDLLRRAFATMKGALSSRTDALESTQAKLAKLVELGIAIAAERDSTRLLDMILVGAKDLANADGGTIYRRDEENQLHFQIMRNDTLGMVHGLDPDEPIDQAPVPLYDPEGRPNHGNVVSYAVHSNVTVNIADAYATDRFDFAGTRAADARNNYRSRSILTVPLKPRGGEVIGALQLINARQPGAAEVVPFSEEIQRFVEALAAQAATALYNRHLLAEQDRLLDAMIKLIAGAIDAKSPYTGGHCERVPELAFMLAEEACKVDKGPIAAFNFASDEEWREFRVGAWLHDCGKVVTPEYVVDKATKLETIYNRIHEVRARCEILWRDAEIDRLKEIAAGADADEAARRCRERQDKLTDDFAFIAACNIGGEYLSPEKIERLNEIAGTTWLRHFDERLGLAPAEVKLFGDAPPEPLPAVEHLLADKPYHIVPRPESEGERYNGLGFKLPVPEHLYDRGELHNLAISRGTLTAEERYKINEHIMQTIAMLESMPFPKHLRRVPEYAGTHHETLVGSGYPRRLGAGDLSVPARIMAIADIFEALTASDRPYKTAKSLSESVRILSTFKQNGHIDPDLFDLFLTSGVHLRYAERFLAPEQIDRVDVASYVGGADPVPAPS